jgi:hypothetical protein
MSAASADDCRFGLGRPPFGEAGYLGLGLFRERIPAIDDGLESGVLGGWFVGVGHPMLRVMRRVTCRPGIFQRKCRSFESRVLRSISSSFSAKTIRLFEDGDCFFAWMGLQPMDWFAILG